MLTKLVVYNDLNILATVTLWINERGNASLNGRGLHSGAEGNPKLFWVDGLTSADGGQLYITAGIRSGVEGGVVVVRDGNLEVVECSYRFSCGDEIEVENGRGAN